MNLKSLAKDTAIYGLSSIVGRFLNYLLVILHTRVLPADTGGYGIVSNLYAWTALLLALLTFGMETTFLRFAGKEDENSDNVYGTSLKMVGTVGLSFLILLFSFLGPISNWLGYATHPEYIACFGLITFLDAFQAIMFVRLRQQKRPVKFMCLKLSFIFASIILNLFVFLVLPRFFGRCPGLEETFGRFDHGTGFIFFINLICTAGITLGFIPELKGLNLKFDRSLCKRMLKYTWPILLLSLVGVMNQVADKILLPKLMPGKDGMIQLGVYGACVKIAMVMAMLTQAFRYAYEPIVFGGVKDRNSEKTLADGMKYYIIFTILAYLAVIVYLPLLKYIIDDSYWAGLSVVPIVMLAEIFMGIYFNLSFWYKLTDQTWWGAIMNFTGAAVMIAANVLFVPKYGYMACAWGGLAGYGVAMLMSWFIGQRKYPVRYDGRTIFTFIIIGLAYYCIYTEFCRDFSVPVQIAIGTALLLSYCSLTWKFLKKEE